MLSLFLAKRFMHPRLSKEEAKAHSGASVPAIRIAIAGIAVGLAVMIVTLCVVKGFQREVSNKIIGFASHIELLDQRAFASPESYPIVTDQSVVNTVKRTEGVTHVQRFSEKMGIIKTDEDFMGVCLKGVAESDYDLTFLKQCVVEGKLPQWTDTSSSNQIAISRLQAEKLHLKLGDKVNSYFFSNSIKQRVFKVAAIYDTQMHQFDKTFILTDLYTVNRLNNWATNQSSGLEIRVKDMESITPTHILLKRAFTNKTDSYGGEYSLLNIYENPRTGSVLSWLKLLDFNILVILVIMLCVAGIGMISGLLILILERTTTIGLLKALGATNRRIRRTFLWYAFFIVGKGLIWGNVIGFAVIGLQANFHVFHLDPASYYVDTVPVEVNALWLVGINLLTLALTMLALIVPSFLVSKVQPAKAIQFD